jgi:hypothetical protein
VSSRIRPWVAALAVLHAAAVRADVLPYPGVGPCSTTLQACIDGAAAGDTVEIATNSPIDASITIAKSLTLTRRGGFAPVLGSAATHRTLTLTDAGLGGGAVQITVADLTLNNAEVLVLLDDDSGHAVTVRGLDVAHSTGGTSGKGIAVELRAPASSVVLRQNRVQAPGDAIRLAAQLPSGEGTLMAVANRVTTFNPTGSRTGILVELANEGTATAYVYSNVIYGVSRGVGGAGIDVFSSGNVTGAVSIVNNTLDDVQGSSNAIQVRNPTGSAQVAVNVFNNLVTNGSKSAVAILSPGTSQLELTHGFNDFVGSAAADDYGGYGPAGPGTISVDPLYVNRATGDFRLQAGSPVIDAGASNPVGGLPDMDAAGSARLVGAGVDIGAFELGAPTSTTTTTTVPGQSTTTTTLAPPCFEAVTFPSLKCRVDVVVAAARAAATTDRTLAKLETLLERGRAQVQLAEDLRAQGKIRPTIAALTRALRALGRFQARLRSRRGRKDVPEPARTDMIDAAETIRRDLRLLRG